MVEMMNKKEGEHYQIIPSSEEGDLWEVRILDGIFVETILRFGTISFNEIGEGVMKFNFDIVSSPDENLVTENEDLQLEVTKILESILENAINEGYITMREKE